MTLWLLLKKPTVILAQVWENPVHDFFNEHQGKSKTFELIELSIKKTNGANPNSITWTVTIEHVVHLEIRLSPLCNTAVGVYRLSTTNART
jgi:hypothetical protein